MSARAIYASTACLASAFDCLEAQLDAYQQAGLTRIELGHSRPHRTADLQSELASRRASFLVHNYFPPPAEPFVLNLASADPKILGQSRELVYRALDLCAALGAPFYSVHSGFRGSISAETLGRELSFRDVEDTAPSLRRFRETVIACADRAKTLGLRLLLEPNVLAPFNLAKDGSHILLMTEPEEVSAFLREVEHPALGLLLDTGHLHVTARTLGFSRDAFLRATTPWIEAFHLHDNDGSADQHNPVTAESWVWPVLNDPRHAAAPVIVEAKFPTVGELAAHVRWLETRLCSPQ